MTSSIFRPRMSRAWPEPSTHLTASTMFVLPEPFGPTMAVTPPSNWISVCRAKVLKPSNCRDLRNKLAGRLADVGDGGPQATTYKPRRRPASAGKRGFQWNGAITGTRGIERYEGARYSIGSPNWRLRGGSDIACSGTTSAGAASVAAAAGA